MTILRGEEAARARAIAEIGFCNPFSERRMALERAALGDRYLEERPFIHLPSTSGPAGYLRNDGLLGSVAEPLAEQMRTAIANGRRAGAEEQEIYRNLIAYLLFHRYMGGVDSRARRFAREAAGKSVQVGFWKEYRADYAHYMELPGLEPVETYRPDHMFAILFQIGLAFGRIYDHLRGGSRPAARLRMAVWESIFTRDMARYARQLYRAMDDVPTLITGPSGTGKELVARAIGLSRFVPFDPKSECFAAPFDADFHPVNISSLPKTLVESELFGHCKGAFTGATSDRLGWLESCGPYGCVFIDEIGELDSATQVMLLRVLEDRRFQRVGETRARTFNGKIVSATHRDLAREVEIGKFREDFYYRLCADVLRTPSLQEQLNDCPSDLTNLVRHIVGGFVGDDEVVDEGLTFEVVAAIERQLPPGYPWPGNMRELEQCVRNIVIRGSYQPLAGVDSESKGDPRAAFAQAAIAGRMTLSELQAGYCALVVSQTGSYRQAAERLASDRRTVRRHASPELVASFRDDRDPETDYELGSRGDNDSVGR